MVVEEDPVFTAIASVRVRVLAVVLAFMASGLAVPHDAWAAFTPSVDDSLVYTGSIAADSEAFPEAIALGPGGAIYYTHSDQNRPLQGYDPDPSTYVIGTTQEGVELLRVGSEDASEFQRPSGIDFTSDGMLVIADSEHNRIRVYDTVSQEFIYTYGESDFGDAQFAIPRGVTVAPDDTLWIADTDHNKIQHLTLWGGFIGEFPMSGGTADQPDGIGIDPEGNVWVAVPNQNRIDKYDPEGALLLSVDDWQEVDSEGVPTQTGTFSAPRGIGVDPWGVVYVGDSANGRIIRLDNDGDWLGTLNPSDVLQHVSDIEVDAFGNVYASDPVSDAIYRFTFVMDGEDTEPPITLSNIPSGWRNDPLLVTLNAADNANDILGTWYSTDGSFPTIPYTGPFWVSDEGDTTIQFYSADEAQNFETVKTRHLKLDFGMPTTTSDAQSGYASTAVVNFTANDTLSGIAKTEYSRDGGTWRTGTVFTSTVGGTHTLRFRSVDAAGNVEPYTEVVYSVTPRIDQSDTGVYYEGSWEQYFSVSRHGYYWLATDEPNSYATFRFTGTGLWLIGSKGPGFGIASVQVDDGDPMEADFYSASLVHQQQVLQIAGLEDTEHVVTIAFTGNKNPLSEGTMIGIDALDLAGQLLPDVTPPTTTALADQEWQNTPVQVELNANDDDTWVTSTYYRVDSGASHTYTEPFALDYDGIHTITFWSVDRAGNVESPTAITTYADWTPPTTTSSIPAGWTNDDVVVSLDATDGESGVLETLYSTDGSEPFETYIEPFVVSAEGVTTIKYSSLDNLTNPEDTKTESVQIDRDKPVCSIDVPPATVDEPARITIDADDSLSGVASITYAVDGGAPTTYTGPFDFTAAGDHTIEAWSTDAAGNSSTVDTAEFNVTYTTQRYEQDHALLYSMGTWSNIANPALSAGTMGKVFAGPAGKHLTFTGTAIDVIALKSPRYGIAKVTLDGGAPTYVDLYSPVSEWQAVVWSATELEDAVHTLSFEFTGLKNPLAIANEFNVDAFDITGSMIADTQAPTTADNVVDAWSGSTVNVALSAADLGSWVSSTRYAINGGSPITYSGPIAVSGEGVTTVTYRSVDFAGNTETTQSALVRIDKTAPTSSATVLPTYKSAATVEIDSSDASGSGVLTTEWRIDDEEWVSGSTATLSYDEGPHVLQYRSTDAVGNVEQAKSATYRMMTRVEQTDSRLYLQGGWFRIDNAALSAGSMHKITSGTGGVYLTFTGTAVDYVALKSPRYGVAKVTLDGGDPTYVDLYDPNSEWQDVVWSASDLADTTHTLAVEYTGLKNPSATANELNVDAFDVAGTVEDYSVYVEQDDTRLYSDPAWFTINNASLSGTSMRKAVSNGSTYVTFRGTSIDMISLKSPRYGIAKVTVDGGTPSYVDLYAPESEWKSVVWSATGLSDTLHTVEIAWTGTKNPAATEAEVNVDALVIRGTVSQHKARHETSNSKIYFTPDWFTVNSTHLSGGSMRKANEADSSAFVTFKGTEVSLIGLKTVSYGKAHVSIDGAAPETVDLYSPTDNWQSVLWSATELTDTTHTVSFKWTGDKNAAATGTAVGLDAVEVVGTLATAVPNDDVYVRYEQDSGAVAYTGSWFPVTSANVSGGTLAKTGGVGDTVYISFDGTGFKWVGLKTRSYGIAEVTLDGGAPMMVDLYAPTDLWKSKIWSVSGLEDGPHTVSIQWTGDRNALSTGTAIAVDAFDVIGTLTAATPEGVTPWVRHEQSAPGITFQGPWTAVSSSNLSGSSGLKSSSATGSVSVSFDGTACSWIGLRTVSYGIASVSVDGGDPELVDLYAASDQWKSKLWSVSGLSDGPHTVTIRWTGTKNPASSGTSILVDAFDIRGEPTF